MKMADEIQDPHAEYPKMLFKQGVSNIEHQIDDKPLTVAGVKGLGYLIVQSLDEERVALEEGYFLTPALQKIVRKPDARDTEIEELKRQLEEATAPPKTTLKIGEKA